MRPRGEDCSRLASSGVGTTPNLRRTPTWAGDPLDESQTQQTSIGVAPRGKPGEQKPLKNFGGTSAKKADPEPKPVRGKVL